MESGLAANPEWRTGGGFAGLFAGAGLLGLIDGALELPYPAGGFRRELVILVPLGAMLVALAAGIVLRFFRRRCPGEPFLTSQEGFWIGWGIALMPFAGHYLPRPWLGILPGLVVVAAAFPLGARFGPRIRTARLLSWGTLAVALASFLLFPPPTITETGPWDLPPAEENAASPEGPDLILVSVDTLRADAVVGPHSAAVPFLDELRSQGTWAKFARSCSNQTRPGHTTMLTGLDTFEHGVRYNADSLREGLPMVSQVLHRGGYRTVGVVTNGIIRGEVGFHRGFEVFDDGLVAWPARRKLFIQTADDETWLGWILPNSRLETLITALLGGRGSLPGKNQGGRGAGRTTTDRGLHYLDQLLAQKRPYFLFLHFMDPHSPYGAPVPFRGTRTADMDPLPEKYRPPREGMPVKRILIEKVEADLDAGKPEAAYAARYFHELYLEEVSFVDACLKEIMERVKRGGRPTILLLTGDHGEMFGEHGLLEHGKALFEPLVRVPFLLWGPGIPHREIVPPDLVDVAPTLVKLAGMDAGPYHGRPVLDLPGADGGGGLTAPGRVQISRDEKRLSLASGPWKWMADWRVGQETPEVTGLFNLAEDPGEEHDLSGGKACPLDFPALARKAIGRDTFSPSLEPTSPLDQLLLQQLGYAGGGDEADTSGTREN